MRHVVLEIGLFCASAPVICAQSLIVPDNTVRTVIALSASDGTLEAAGFMDLDDGLIASNRPYQAAIVGNELWFTDDVTSRVTRWNSYGSVQLGAIDLAPHRLRGITAAFGSVWVGGGNPSGTIPDFLIQLTPSGALVAQHPMPGVINGVTAFGNQLLVGDADHHDLLLVDPATGAITGTFHNSNGFNDVSNPGQIVVEPNGHVLVASGLFPGGVWEYDSTGNQVAFFDTSSLPQNGSVAGVARLGDGDLLFTTGTGVYRYGVSTHQIELVIGSLIPYYFATVPSIPLGTTVCSPGVANSTGRAGTVTAVGSNVVADSAVRLCAQDLPLAATGYFLASTTAGHVPNAGGSQGTLCLGGSVGRFNQQIGFTGNDGFFSITVDPHAVPQPSGAIAIMAGETWRFQCWHRDVNPTVTSNFTDATEVTFQ